MAQIYYTDCHGKRKKQKKQRTSPYSLYTHTYAHVYTQPHSTARTHIKIQMRTHTFGTDIIKHIQNGHTHLTALSPLANNVPTMLTMSSSADLSKTTILKITKFMNVDRLQSEECKAQITH